MASDLPGALAPLLTPQGHLRLAAEAELPALPATVHERILTAFSRGAGHGLLQLGAVEVGSILPPAFAWWRDFAAHYVTALCTTTEAAEFTIAAPDDAALGAMIASAPPMTGGEYLTPAVLATLWADLDAALRAQLAASGQSLQEFLKALHPAWNLVGRVYFNLAENRQDLDAPFAFLATYTPRLSARGNAQHLPLKRALAEYAGSANKAQLLSLLLPVQRAAEQCDWLRDMVVAGEIYHPLRWTPAEAWCLLKDHHLLETAGIRVRAPGGWPAGRPTRPKVTTVVGLSLIHI